MRRNAAGFIWAVSFLALILRGGVADAATVAIDEFADPVGAQLLGQSGGSGFVGPWSAGGFNASIHDNYTIASGSLTFPPLPTGGNRSSSGAVNAIAGLTRAFATPLGADHTTAYLSVLLRPEGTLGDGAFNGFFGLYLNGTNATGDDLFIGKPGANATDRYVVENRGGAGQVASGVAPVVGQNAFLVLRADFLPGDDRFTLYLNPTPGGPEPASGAVKTDLDLGTVPGLTIYCTGAFSLDEIRVGTTFADVAPSAVPMPSAAIGGMFLLATIGGAKLMRRHISLRRATIR